MKKFILFVSIILGMTPFAIPRGDAGENPERDICEMVDIGWVRQHAPVPSGTIVSRLKTGPLCQIVLKIKNELVPIFAGEDFIIAGEMMKKRHRITQMTMDDIRTAEYREYVPFLARVSKIGYTPGNHTGRTMYLITDPLCPYCEQLGDEIIDLADTYGVAVRAILYSVHGEKGNEKSVEAICGGGDLKRFVATDWENSKETKDRQCGEGKKTVEETGIIMAAMGIGSVPKLIMDDGRHVGGADTAAIADMLGERQIWAEKNE